MTPEELLYLKTIVNTLRIYDAHKALDLLEKMMSENTKAEKALGEIREAIPPKPRPGDSLTLDETLNQWGKLGTVHQILDTYYGRGKVETHYRETIIHKGVEWLSNVTVTEGGAVFYATYFAPIKAGDDVMWDGRAYHVIEIRPDDGAVAMLVESKEASHV